MSVRERLRQFIAALGWVSLAVGALLMLSTLPASWALMMGDETVFQIYNALWRFLVAIPCIAFGMKYGP